MLNETRSTADLTQTSGVPSARPRLSHRWAGIFFGTLAAATLAACGSSVKLDNVPVEDRGNLVNAQSQVSGAAGTGASVDQRNVSGVDVARGDVVQPTGMARTVYFDYDSFAVRPEFAATLEAHAKYLAANNSRKVALEGHTDERGGREYNLALGQKRGDAVRRALSLLGVREVQMEAVSFGEEKPAVTGFDEAVFVKNRRVELTYR
jgi:peptidoglycan-associated lipoprotein